LRNPVGARQQIGIGEHGVATGGADCGSNLFFGRSDKDLASRRLARPAPDPHNHRLAGDVGERFSRQPGRFHAGRNDNQCIVAMRAGHGLALKGFVWRGKIALARVHVTYCGGRGKQLVSAPQHMLWQGMACAGLTLSR
jgi:hypothetical protein